MGKGRYLRKVTLQDALSTLLERSAGFAPVEAERVPVAEAAGRICAEWVMAKLSSPPFDLSAMDGVAVVASTVEGASDVRPVRLKVPDQAKFVDTGNPIPEGCDAVVMVEYVVQKDEGEVEVMAPAVAGQHVRRAGEDIGAGDPVVGPGERITPYVQGLLLAGGQETVPVRRKPVVYIVPTGKELVKDGTKLKKGQLIEYNSVVLSGLVHEWGGKAVCLDPVPDDKSALEATVRELLPKCDVVVLNGGSSAGRGDFVPDVIGSMGELTVHGVSIRPGKPLAIGFVDGKPVLGVPGYPVSAIVTFDQFVKPLLAQLLGARCRSPRRVVARTRRKIPGKLGADEFVRVRLAWIDGEFVASPLKRGSGLISSIAHADGIVRIPSLKEGVGENESVEVELLRDEEDVRHSVVGFGSYDPVVQVLADILRESGGIRLVFTAIGSVGALAAVGRGECHFAAFHMSESGAGEDVAAYVKRYVGDVGTLVVKIVPGKLDRNVTPRKEQYYLVIPDDLMKSDGVRELLEVVRSD